MFTRMTPMLICDDVQKSIKFYTDVIGLEVTSRMDDVGNSGWAHLSSGGVNLMLASPSYLPKMPKVEGRFDQALYYFYTDDVDALRRRICEAGHKPGEIVERFYGLREFELTDPDGHHLLFGQEAPESTT